VPGDQRLVAYVVGDAAPEALRAHLGSRLPEYMVPAAYVRLDALPLTPNGKLDRRALPAPEAGALAPASYTALQTETERAVAALWSQLLAVPIEHIGREADFFALGGHSLLAVRLASQVQQALQRSVPLREIFSHRTVHALASPGPAVRAAGGAAAGAAQHQPLAAVPGHVLPAEPDGATARRRPGHGLAGT
jgi:acyl carrier protein